MASGTKRKNSGRGGNRKQPAGRKQNTAQNRGYSNRRINEEDVLDDSVKDEICLIVLLAVCVLLFLCNFGIGGTVGSFFSGLMFGLFGFTAYIFPIIVFIAAAFWISNPGNRTAMRKLVSALVLYLVFAVLCDITSGKWEKDTAVNIADIYSRCSLNRNGGGVFGGFFAWLLIHFTGTAGAVIISVVAAVICILLISGKALLHAAAKRGMELGKRAASYREERQYDNEDEYDDRTDEDDQEAFDELNEQRIQERQRRREEFEERRRIQKQEREEAARQQKESRLTAAESVDNSRILNRDYSTPVVGIANTKLIRDDSQKTLRKPEEPVFSKENDDIHEIVLDGSASGQDDDRIEVHVHDSSTSGGHGIVSEDAADDADDIREITADISDQDDNDEFVASGIGITGTIAENAAPDITVHSNGVVIGTDNVVRYGTDGNIIPGEEGQTPQGSYGAGEVGRTGNTLTPNNPNGRPAAFSGEGSRTAAQTGMAGSAEKQADVKPQKPKPRPYVFPPLSILTKGQRKTTDNSAELKATAAKLENTLKTFGVDAKVTDVSQGPAVTRYELHPESGVKVSKIVGLTDDIKLNLAATDIRIEAPIPGKAAVGIEVPNRENSTVALRDLLESKAFKDFPSGLAFAVGKDIGGQIVVTDIAKMPHMLIAGATGSGKSVCINTIIMSILYKAKPDEVKLIMIDPKVVELSVYNGIPHLIIPVVTDPKKAAGALQWGVTEMTDRYQKFADMNVRDIKGYNKKAESMKASGDPQAPDILPQIVIIVDELADLMMVAPGEVEESICRLAQLARAAGIHLIIATQRPSVDVITGLIKANMPSRVAFAVSSGVDSRTILDMNGAEKLLGKGDMLFYPQGYPKPARIQGAFVSDKEVQDVVTFIQKNAGGEVYDPDVENKIKEIEKASGNGKNSAGQVSDPDDQSPDIDQLFADAGILIIDKDKASIGMFQRAFKIGFNRAARIMDQLSEYGVVSEEDGTKPRKILMDRDAFEQLLSQLGGAPQ
jgi:S-DNA-T family DNA segregation ATPase FtsK/SpoIIIE